MNHLIDTPSRLPDRPEGPVAWRTSSPEPARADGGRPIKVVPPPALQRYQAARPTRLVTRRAR